MNEGISTLISLEEEIDLDSLSHDELLEFAREQRKTILRLKEDAAHDELTGLKTRKVFEAELQAHIGASHEGEHRKEGYKHASILMIDIDHFKSINDTYGHPVGDQALRKTAKVISNHVRGIDIAARLGGEEFGVILFGADEAEAIIKAEEIRKAVEGLVIEEIPSLFLSISIGVRECTPGLQYKEIYLQGDEALYEAKNTGRNRIVPYSSM